MAFGLRPVRRLSGTPYNGEAATYEITAADAAVIYYHAPVTFAADGSIRASAAAEEHLGVFLGCEYADVTGEYQYRQAWPADTTVTGPVIAYVADSPDLVFEVETATALGAVANPTLRGLNADIVVPSPAGTAATGQSLVQLNDYRDDTTETVYKIYRVSPKATSGSSVQIVEVIVVKHALLTLTSRTGVPAT